eukprot:5476713-Prymnesium_polylepis.1
MASSTRRARVVAWCAVSAANLAAVCSVPAPPVAAPSPALVNWDASRNPALPFSIPFALSAHNGKLWIAPEFKLGTPDESSSWEPFKIKGTNWAGFQAGGCVHELWKRD